MSVTCLDIELAIMREFNFRQNLIVPNVSNMMGLVAFETDMLIITPNGYATGFEIKVSKSDLMADFKKPQHTRFNELRNGKTGFEIYYGKLKYFFYAVPDNLQEVALSVIPNFCGLYVFTEGKYGYSLPIFKKVREPQKLFDYKWDDKRKFEVARLGAMRIHDLKQSILCNIKNKESHA